MTIRTLTNGRAVTVHRNDGLRKRCDCPRRAWLKCPHSWHFSFKWKDAHHRFPLDRYSATHIASKDAARAEADRLRTAIRNGDFPPAPAATPPQAPADVTFEAFADLWRTRARDTQSPTQQSNEKYIVRRLVAREVAPGETLGQRVIGRITEDDLEVAFRGLTLAASTRNKYLQVIRHLQRWGVKKGYLTHPWLSEDTDLKRQKHAKRERRLMPDVLTTDGRVATAGEERRLLAVAGAWLQRLIIAALHTACRRGELLSLQWGDVDLAGGELTIRAEKAKDGETRFLPISPELHAVLEMVRLDPAGEPHAPTAYVFGNRVGEHIADPKKTWAKACRAAAIQGLTFHDLRHEAASRMLERGWPLHHVQNMLGHADVKTTSTYLNLTRGGLRESMKKFGTGPVLHNVAHAADSERPPMCNDAGDAARKSLTH